MDSTLSTVQLITAGSDVEVLGDELLRRWCTAFLCIRMAGSLASIRRDFGEVWREASLCLLGFPCLLVPARGPNASFHPRDLTDSARMVDADQMSCLGAWYMCSCSNVVDATGSSNARRLSRGWRRGAKHAPTDQS